MRHAIKIHWVCFKTSTGTQPGNYYIIELPSLDYIGVLNRDPGRN
jgi:hypothetical protein